MENKIVDDVTTENIEKEVVETPEKEPTNEQLEEAQKLADLEAKNRQMFERTKKAEQAEKEAKEELERLSVKSSGDGQQSEEGLALTKRIDDLQSELSQSKSQSELNRLQVEHPELKDKMEDFKTFQENPDNAGMSQKTQVKAFLVENDLYKSTIPKRKGLEKTTGNVGKPSPSGSMTADEVARLRTTNYRKYKEMIKSGTLKIKTED